MTEAAAQWRDDEYPAIGEILDWQTDSETSALRYLRTPQLRALEVYWYLRLVKGTPHIFDLYQDLFSSTAALLDALGIPRDAFEAADYDLDTLWDRIRSDDDFVGDHSLEALRESIDLDYPSFVIRRKDGNTLIVEIKREHDRHHPTDGEAGCKTMAVRKWQELDPERLRYEIIFTPSGSS